MTTSSQPNKKHKQHKGDKDTILAECVRKSVRRYLKDLNGEQASDMYNMVLKQVEKPLLEAIMQHSKNNQSKASRVLGIHPSTLRKKLSVYNIKSEV